MNLILNELNLVSSSRFFFFFAVSFARPPNTYAQNKSNEKALNILQNEMKNKSRKAQTTVCTVHTHAHEHHTETVAPLSSMAQCLCVCRRSHGRAHSCATTHSSHVLLNIYMYRTQRYFVHCVAQNVFTFRRICRCEYCCVWDSTLAMAKVHNANDRLSDFHSSPIEIAFLRPGFQSFASDKIVNSGISIIDLCDKIFTAHYSKTFICAKAISVARSVPPKNEIANQQILQRKSGFQSPLAASLRLLASHTDEIPIGDEIMKTGKKIYERRKYTRNQIEKGLNVCIRHSLFCITFILSIPLAPSCTLSASVFRWLLACLDDGKKIYRTFLDEAL